MLHVMIGCDDEYVVDYFLFCVRLYHCYLLCCSLTSLMCLLSILQIIHNPGLPVSQVPGLQEDLKDGAIKLTEGNGAASYDDNSVCFGLLCHLFLVHVYRGRRAFAIH